MVMYTGFLIYSLSVVFAKLASGQALLSLPYQLCIGGIIAVMGIYAVLWQQVLRMIPLSVAMSNKPLVLVLSALWAVILFKEKIPIRTIAGIILIFCGVFTIGKSMRER